MQIVLSPPFRNQTVLLSTTTEMMIRDDIMMLLKVRAQAPPVVVRSP
jgi:hypothetical protein